ncbi:glutamate [NMDA] receptor subunit 1-like isoform X2 [Mizuhopecten yessoensis]|uniref:glutamate [NMDA] receptor subunit 1-like isoform X2 n=1 Tax=Mizuhopecten yessoensis TaxID=6573 RepID=UPI000B45F0C8|nr:glutamate [NMDA] receptor subunit 1-like isoform X2 [Mizuhopecten yessoensis]
MEIQGTWKVFLLLLFVIQSFANPRIVRIGAILSSPQNQQIFQEAVRNLNNHSEVSKIIRFEFTSILMDPNRIRSALKLCDELVKKAVHIVIVSHPPDDVDQAPISVSYTCGFYNIPVIGISTRDSSFSDKNVHPTFLRTVPPYFHQADAWLEMLTHFAWKQVIFIHSMDEEGRMILSRFKWLAEKEDIMLEKVYKYPSGIKKFTSILKSLPSLQSRVILLSASQRDAESLFRDAKNLNLTTAGYAWIVSEQALEASTIPVGMLGLKLSNSTNEDVHIRDSVQVIGKAMRQFFVDNSDLQNITDTPTDCRSADNNWQIGRKILEALKAEKLEKGHTGQVSFNEDGDRVNAVYFIRNSQQDKVSMVGYYGNKQATEPALKITGENKIVWPGNLMVKPKGVKISTHLKVVTLKATPFVHTELLSEKGSCEEGKNERICWKVNSTTGEKVDYCCYGYCIDMLIDISKKVNFTFELHLSTDNSFGTLTRSNNSKMKTWNGMIGELVSEQSDLIVAPLTINPERAEHIDFSKPFKYQGLIILVKKTQKDSSLASFLQPFQDTLWILVGLSVHVVALVLYLLDRFSPFGRFKLAKSDDTEEDALNLSSAMWFAWGVLLNSGIGEGTPRSFSARVLGMVWAGFAMIIVASYTANLAAFLVLDRPEASITGIDDARLRNPNENFKYATVKNSAVEMYFKRQVELSTMYRQMETRNYRTAEEAINEVKKGELQAFIWDSSRLEYEAAKDCELITAGELFGRSGLGIGLRKKSPWTHDISMAILKLHERGRMEELDNKWILNESTDCSESERDSAPATLGLTNMAGVFMMVAGGIVAGVFLIFVEIAYKRHRGLKEKELELARNAADRWRGNIEKKKQLRESWNFLRVLKEENQAASNQQFEEENETKDL